MERIIVRNGRVVSGSGVREVDVLVVGETIARVEAALPRGADREIDASGCLVLPGVLDVHTHPVYLDDLAALPVTAVHGGVTTLIHYAYAKPGQGLLDTLRRFRDEGEGSSILDFALHGGVFDPASQSSEIPQGMAEGVSSYKMFMTYAKLGWMTDDYQLMRTLDILGRAGGMAMVHAENGLATDYLEDRASAEGADPIQGFVGTRPAILEAEAVHRAMAMAQVAGCPIYIPHVSAQLALDEIREARDKGFRVYAETCPQYLTLTNDDLLRQKTLLKIGPPLRGAGDRDALWDGLAAGTVDTVASDHAPKAKRPDDDFLAAPYGSPQVETMLPLVYDGGVEQGRLTIERLVRVMCENPAKIFGLYPKKGTLLPGSDADLVIFDPKAKRRISNASQHSNAPYTAYQGREVVGAPILCMQRGRVLLEAGHLSARPGCGRFLATAAGRVDPAALR
ncbi:MAG: dihydropyrimidinase [Candidatus Bipolaricaulis sp.]|nr:dihydropyrimidinase [Candidatus Bipolaricaulis sp.]MDD5646136.1 dihydropyrimidinase [Candidatus Bipolaricaulis sp.]